MNKLKKPELLLPSSNLEVLKLAFSYGADAVYIGGDVFSMRARAKNFSKEDMREGIEFAHARGKKVYVTANIIAHNEDLEGFREYFKELKDLQPDALIISDPGVLEIAKEVIPDMEFHISTQANNVNYGTYKFWHRMGAKRVVSGRELSLKEIKEIRQNIPDDLEIETFIHGAMCIAYSGRCLLSNYFTGRDANRGECTHPCRWKYHLTEATRPGEYMPIYENERGTYIFNSKDLCMIEYIPELIDAGIDSFKIEGRMKSALYVVTAARAYRKAIDDYYEDPQLYKNNLHKYKEEVEKNTYREFTTGFFFEKPSHDGQIYDKNTYIKSYTYLGFVQGHKEGQDGENWYELEQRNKFSVGDEIEVMKASGDNLHLKVLGMKDEEGNDIDSCPHPQEIFYINVGEKLDNFDVLRRREKIINN